MNYKRCKVTETRTIIRKDWLGSAVLKVRDRRPNEAEVSIFQKKSLSMPRFLKHEQFEI